MDLPKIKIFSHQVSAIDTAKLCAEKEVSQ
jgi:hypothetical protein